MNQRLEGSILTDDLLAERLRQLRKQAGLSQKALAERLGISGPAVAQWETGRHRPDTRWLPKLASLLNCQPSDLRPDLFQPIPKPRRSSHTDSAVTPVKDAPTTLDAMSSTEVGQAADQNIPPVISLAPSIEIDWTQHTDLVRLDSTPASISPNATTTTVASTDQQACESPLFSSLQLRRARQQRRLERRELAALLHVDAFKIQQWEQGTASPNAWQSHRLAQVLGLRHSQSRATANRVKFTVLQAPNAVRVPILPIYEQPPADASHTAVGHMPAIHAQATLVFRLPVGRWQSPMSTTCLHVQVSPCPAIDVPEYAKAVRWIDQGLCLRQRICLEGQTVWFAPASRFGAAHTAPLQPDEVVWRVWAVVSLSDDDEGAATDSTSEWRAYT